MQAAKCPDLMRTKSMKLPVRLTLVAAGLFLTLPMTAAFAASTVKVSLWDKGADSLTMTDAEMAAKASWT